MRIRLAACWCIVSLLSACASTPGTGPGAPPTADLFSDAGFKPASQPVGSAGLFDLSAPMRAYLHSSTFSNARRNLGARRGLIDALYKKDQLKIEYQSRTTRNAAGSTTIPLSPATRPPPSPRARATASAW